MNYDERNENIINDKIKNNMSLSEIAKKYSISRQRVSKIIMSKNVTFEYASKIKQRYKEFKINQLKKQGKTAEEISNELNINLKYVKKKGNFIKKHADIKNRNKQLIYFYLQGEDVKELARYFNMDERVIRQIFILNKIKRGRKYQGKWLLKNRKSNKSTIKKDDDLMIYDNDDDIDLSQWTIL